MPKNTEDTQSLLTITEASRSLGISTDTLRRWEQEGRVKPVRTVGGHRRYSQADIDSLVRRSA
ncbi:MAG: helix-turn-helix domain-containing protein [Candidatus Nanopelagicales bacterium]